MEPQTSKFWKRFAIVLIILNLALIVILLLPLGEHFRQGGNGSPEKFIVEKLKLTTQQQTDFKKLRIAHHESVMKLQDEGKKLRESLFEGLKSDALSSSTDSIANKIAENQKQIEMVTFNHFTEVRKLCTPQQKEIFNEIIEDVLHSLTCQEGREHRRGH